MNDDLTLAKALDRDPEWRTTAENLMADEIERLRKLVPVKGKACPHGFTQLDGQCISLCATVNLNGDE